MGVVEIPHKAQLVAISLCHGGLVDIIHSWREESGKKGKEGEERGGEGVVRGGRGEGRRERGKREKGAGREEGGNSPILALS